MADTGEQRPVVLVVEDNKINRMVAQQMLKRAGIEALEADSGSRALEALREQRFDLVLMDVQMPGMDGLETAHIIREGGGGEENRRVPILAITAYASPEDETACYDAGMDGYLSKPLNMDSFLRSVREAMQTHGRERRTQDPLPDPELRPDGP